VKDPASSMAVQDQEGVIDSTLVESWMNYSDLRVGTPHVCFMRAGHVHPVIALKGAGSCASRLGMPISSKPPKPKHVPGCDMTNAGDWSYVL
jgi:hypothetical protein